MSLVHPHFTCEGTLMQQLKLILYAIFIALLCTKISYHRNHASLFTQDSYSVNLRFSQAPRYVCFVSLATLYTVL